MDALLDRFTCRGGGRQERRAPGGPHVASSRRLSLGSWAVLDVVLVGPPWDAGKARGVTVAWGWPSTSQSRSGRVVKARK